MFYIANAKKFLCGHFLDYSSIYSFDQTSKTENLFNGEWWPANH